MLWTSILCAIVSFSFGTWCLTWKYGPPSMKFLAAGVNYAACAFNVFIVISRLI